MSHETAPPPSTSDREQGALPSGAPPFITIGAHALFFLSGASALVYEVVWVRSLSLVFGGSQLAVTTVVSIFMLGLAIGSFLAGRYLPLRAVPLRLYGLVEAGIAVCAVLFWAVSRVYPAIYVPLARLAPESPAYLTIVRVMLASIGMLPATVLMGATLPLLSAFAADRCEAVGSRVSLLYGINTIGAVVGAVVTGFVLLPSAGVGAATGVAVATSAAIGAAAIGLSHLAGGARSVTSTPPALEAPTTASDGSLALAMVWAAAISGFCALGYEVLWTRVLILGVGATDYGFTAVLASFLASIGLGGAAYKLVARPDRGSRDVQRLWGLGALQLGIALAMTTAAAFMESLPGLYVALRSALESAFITPFHARQLANFALALIYLGPAAFAMGVSFPLVGDVYARQRHTTADAVGRVTSANTLGAILGSAVSGYVLIHAVGIERAIQLLVVVNGGLGLWLIAKAGRSARYRFVSVSIAAVAAVALVSSPDRFRVWDRNYFAIYRSNRAEAFATREMREAALRRAEVVYLAEGVSSIVSAVRTGGVLAFATNGRVEASTGFRDVQNQYALGHLPMLLHPNPRTVLVVGAGAGMTAGATVIHPSVERVTLVELEPKVLGVVRAFASFNHALLANPRLKVIMNDGRNHLLTTSERYDVITADPIHPWFRGAGYLYTAEYFRLAASRLRPGGVMAQWLPLYQMSPEHVASVCRTFGEAFAHTQAWLVHSDVVLIGSNSPIVIDESALASRLANPAIQHDMAAVMMGTTEDLLSYFAMGTAGLRAFSTDARINTDDNLYLEFSSPRAIGRVITEPENIVRISRYRESVAAYARFSIPESQARWESSEVKVVLQLVDRAQALGIAGAYQSPEFIALAALLDRRAGSLGRWRVIQQERQALGL